MEDEARHKLSSLIKSGYEIQKPSYAKAMEGEVRACPDEARHKLSSLIKSSYEIQKPSYAKAMEGEVGATGFEPATSSSRTKRATGLRYAPKNWERM